MSNQTTAGALAHPDAVDATQGGSTTYVPQALLTAANTRNAELEAALAERDQRRCEDCADHEGEEPCDRFSDSFLAFMRDHCNGKPVSCCFWTARAAKP